MVLKQLAEEISPLRFSDLAARYGREEFTITLRDTDISSAAAWAERFRKYIEDVLWDPYGKPITVSMGLAGLKENMPIENQKKYDSKNRPCS